MRNKFSKYIIIVVCLIFSSKSYSQLDQVAQELNLFLNDAVFYSDKYVTPATNVAVYQSSSNWMTSPKKRKLFDVTLSLHGNVFFVPKSDRSFEIINSDFSFFIIQNANSQNSNSAIVPTALGGSEQYYLVGSIAGNQVKIQTPKGVDSEQIMYPYLQGSVALWKGFEVVAKYSTKVKLKKGDFQVYGVGLKHNFSQYINSLRANKIHLAALVAYSKEDISFDFLDVQTNFGNLGIDRISGLVDTYQFQISGSKEWKNFELTLSSITNTSDFKYKLSGKRGSIEDVIPVQQIFNDRLKQIYKTKINGFTEISGRHQFSKIYVQTTIAFGKFVNSNLSVQYEF